MDPRRNCRAAWRSRRAAVAVGVALALLTTGCSATDAGKEQELAGGLFDDSTVHDIDVTFDQTDYDAMVAAYQASGEKEWISGTVTIDGTTFENVGLRLKGNSSLSGLGGGLSGRAGVVPTRADDGDAAAEEPESLPWLVRLDKYVDGQAHDGLSSFVIRSNSTATSLNEAVALELVGLAGLATQDAAASRLSVNGSEGTLRLIVESPDDAWEEDNFASDGVLYKAEAGGDYSYRGDDPDSYVEVFDQETNTDSEDLTPLIEFLDFVNNSDDATFAATLDQHLDTDAFARYLAVQELIDNFDDIDGPGNNSYLRYDAENEQFTVVTWDLNLAFGAMGGMPGAAGLPDGMALPEGMEPREGMEPPEGMELPEGMEPPEGMDLPEGMEPPAGSPGGRSNVLVERFMANETFNAAYETAKGELTQQLYASGAATEILDRWTTVLKEHAGDVVDAATVDEEASVIAEQIT